MRSPEERGRHGSEIRFLRYCQKCIGETLEEGLCVPKSRLGKKKKNWAQCMLGSELFQPAGYIHSLHATRWSWSCERHWEGCRLYSFRAIVLQLADAIMVGVTILG